MTTDGQSGRGSLSCWGERGAGGNIVQFLPPSQNFSDMQQQQGEACVRGAIGECVSHADGTKQRGMKDFIKLKSWCFQHSCIFRAATLDDLLENLRPSFVSPIVHSFARAKNTNYQLRFKVYLNCKPNSSACVLFNAEFVDASCWQVKFPFLSYWQFYFPRCLDRDFSDKRSVYPICNFK